MKKPLPKTSLVKLDVVVYRKFQIEKIWTKLTPKKAIQNISKLK